MAPAQMVHKAAICMFDSKVTLFVHETQNLWWYGRRRVWDLFIVKCQDACYGCIGPHGIPSKLLTKHVSCHGTLHTRKDRFTQIQIIDSV
eukprot:11690867-Ditylum_brightwellii.AAC.1